MKAFFKYVAFLVLTLQFANAQNNDLTNHLSSIHGMNIAALKSLYPNVEGLKTALSALIAKSSTDKFVKINAITAYGQLVSVSFNDGLSAADKNFYNNLMKQKDLFNDEGLRSAVYVSLGNGSFETLVLMDTLYDKEEKIYLQQQILELASNVFNEKNVTQANVGAKPSVLLSTPFEKRQKANWKDLSTKFSNRSNQWYSKLSSKDQNDGTVKSIKQKLNSDFAGAISRAEKSSK